jgi:hypothetical protein
MKTTVDIPDDALRELMDFTKADTKRAAIVHAVNDFNRRQRMARLTKFAGTFKDFMNQGDLGRMRQEGKGLWS